MFKCTCTAISRSAGQLHYICNNLRHSVIIFNPLRMRSRVTVVCLSVCLCVCYRSNCSSVDPCCPSVVIQNRHDTSKVFDSSILLKVLCSKVMASFTSLIGTAIYKVLFVVYSYPNDDTETATFDLTVLIL